MVSAKHSLHLLVLLFLLMAYPALGNDCGLQSPETSGVSTTDQVIYLTGGIIASMLSTLLILGFIIYPALRRQPGDFVFMFSVADLILAIFWIISAVRDPTSSDSLYCQLSATVSTFAAALSVCYNFCFCFYLISVLKNSLKHSQVHYALFHVLSISVSATFSIILLGTDKLGKTAYGTCSSKESTQWSTWPYVIIILAYIILAFITVRYINYSTPDCDRINSVKKDFLQTYTGLLVVTAIMWTIIFITTFLQTLYVVHAIDSCVIPNWIRPLGTVARIGSPFLLSIIRYRDRFVRRYMRKMLFFWKASERSNSLSLPLQELSISELDRSSVNVELSDMTNEDVETARPRLARKTTFDGDMQMIAMLSASLRVQIIYTILCGVVYSDNVMRKKNLPKIEISEGHPEKTQDPQDPNSHSVPAQEDPKDTPPKNRQKSDIFKNFTKYQLSKRNMQAEVPEFYEKIETKQYAVLHGDFIFYCENIFGELREQDKAFLDTEESLDLVKNEQRVRKAGEGRGGKSGEFFFFSYDNKLIIKTMTTDELRVLLNIIERYHKHNVLDNPKSLIAKIYGVFTYQRDNDPEPVHLVMMRNVNGWPGECVIRKYDLKGSSFSRQVEKRNNITKDDLDSDETYKDIDFLNYDKTFNIKEELKAELRAIIRKDVEFFQSCGIIDYSLAVYIINKSRAKKRSKRLESAKLNENLEPDTDSPRSVVPSEVLDPEPPKAEDFNEFYSMQSQEDGDLYYNMGIIDFLQLYTLQKMAEKYCKRIIHCNLKLDTSSKNPIKYCQRFMKFIDKTFA